MLKSILLVEDNPTDEKLTIKAFAKCTVPHDLTIVRDGAEAVDYLMGQGVHEGRRGRSLPSLVLLDLRLPRVDGFDVMRRARSEERTRLLPLVVLTASKEEEDILQSYALGANAYVRKPVDFHRFVQAIEAIAAFWLGLNETVTPKSGGDR